MDEKTLMNNIIIRPLLQKDSEKLFMWINDRDLVLFNAPYKPIMEANHKAWFENLPHINNIKVFAICHKDVLIGTCQLHSIDFVSRSAELQIRIGDNSHQNKGYGKLALKQLISFGFKDLNLNRIFLHVFTDNLRAIKVYQALGFELEGELREAVFVDNCYKNMFIMSILRNEYLEKQDCCHTST